jgi:hypothetical protein
MTYSEKDPRIRVRNNQDFVNADENHNVAFRLISAQSKYCKVVSADDWIAQDCLSKMVQFAEKHPSVGIIGSYQRSGDHVKWRGLPTTVSVMAGRDACRRALLESVHIFGTPTASLYRSDLVRMRDSFFPHTRPHADTSVCYEYLQFCDFGFMHEVLSVERVHVGQMSSHLESLAAGTIAYLEILLQYGPLYLTNSEYAFRKKVLFDEYYRFLGGCVLKLRNRAFWQFQSSRMEELGCKIDRRSIVINSIREAFLEIKSPVNAVRKAIDVLNNKLGGYSKHRK